MSDFNFKFYGNTDVTGVQRKIADAGLDWDEFNFRQLRHKHHRETKTIPLLFNEENLFLPKYWDHYDLFGTEIANIKLLIEKVNAGEGILRTAVLVMLPAKSKIYSHIDSGAIFKVSKRLHIPITTNMDCLFTVDEETIHMKEGEVWEINNDGKRHGVVNNGDTDRIHLMMDWEQTSPLPSAAERERNEVRQ